MKCLGIRTKKEDISGKSKVKVPDNKPNSRADPSHVGNSVQHSQLKEMNKSNVIVESVNDPNISDLIDNCQTEKVKICAIKKEDKSYVREKDYLEEKDFQGVDPVPSTKVASYKTGDASELSTPPIKKFYYDCTVHNIANIDRNNGSPYDHAGVGESDYRGRLENSNSAKGGYMYNSAAGDEDRF